MINFNVTEKYDHNKFARFLREFLPYDFEPENEPIWGDTKLVDGDGGSFILGTSESLDLVVFEFKHNHISDPRVSLTKEVVSLMKNQESHSNALAVFYNPTVHQWRLSLITTGFEIVDGKIKHTYSNPRRFSYQLGPGCKRHTPESMLLKSERLYSIEDLKSRFALEVVSKEFFNSYREKYADFVEYITGKRYVKVGSKFEERTIKAPNGLFSSQFSCNEKEVRDYVKKLFGRLVFLHFLQKKGWLGVKPNQTWGTGDKDFVMNLFQRCSRKDDFLRSVLEPLFFETLNTDRGVDSFAPASICQCYGERIRIPYLNGGLFEKDTQDMRSIVFPKERFSDLLRFFDTYNFTIDESDPSEKEIGIDPEMLGKVFENLLEDNKDKGAFYTPKEVVQYMCRESLVGYLLKKTTIESSRIYDFVVNHSVSFSVEEKNLISKALKEVKICDPAVGSGAFPMGMMNELLTCRLSLNENYSQKERADLKKEIIKNNIYGVDIEKGAVDIARLRFWLAIIVDETDPVLLPNLDYKIMQGNSLIESYKGIDLSMLVSRNDDYALFEELSKPDELIELVRAFFEPQNQKSKDELRDAINDTAVDFLNKKGAGKDVAIQELKKKNVCANTEFFLWHTWFYDVFNRPKNLGGFDIVIGNPPYLESRNSSFSEELKEKIQYTISLNHSPEEAKSFPRGADLLIFFYELSFRILNEEGLITLITENAWLSTDYGKQFQDYLLKASNVYGIIDSDYKYFETADVNTIITIFGKKNSLNDVSFFHCHNDLAFHSCRVFDAEIDRSSVEKSSFNCSSKFLRYYKWGFLFATDKQLIGLLNRVVQKENSMLRAKIDVGQGLNLTKDHILYAPNANSIPYFTSEMGSLLRWDSATYYVKKSDVKKARKQPILILPRGIGSHFCCFNEVGGFSASYVEIYEERKLTTEEKINLWVFCNSSLLWVLREFTGRCNLGGGMLKAEATDLKTLPLCFDFPIDKTARLFEDAKELTSSSNIEEVVNTKFHKAIDSVVFDYLGFDNTERDYIVNLLVRRFNWRGQKSKTK